MQFTTVSWRCIVGVFLMGALLFALTLLVCRLVPKTGWRAHLDEHYRMLDPSKDLPRLKGDCLREVVGIQAMSRLPEWTEADVTKLTTIVHAGFPKEPPTPRKNQGVIEDEKLSEKEWDEYSVWSEGSSCMSARLDAGAPLPPGAKDLIFACWVSELEESFAQRRYDAAQRLISHKAIEDPLIRKAVEALLSADSEPDTENRELIRFKLKDYDEQKAAMLSLQEKRRQAGTKK